MSRPRLPPAAYTVAWISALPIESAAAAEMLDDEHHDPRSQSSNIDQYVFGRVGDHNIVVARLPSGQMGNNAAAAVVARITTSFPSIRFALMVGIGGGVPSAKSDIRLGDVVVGHPHLQHNGVVQYDFGKTGPNGQMTRTGALDAPPKVLLNAIAKLREDHYRELSRFSTHLSAFDRLPRFSRSKAGPDFLFKATYHHAGGETCENCSREMIVERADRGSEEVAIHYGTIASGNQVMKDGLTRDRLSGELGGVLCFEMEAAGLASTCPCAVIRGICDYADSHKNKSWQPYAAATAAAVAKELLLVTPAEEVTKTDTARRMIDSEKYRIPFSLKGIPQGKFADRPEEMAHLEQVLMPRTQPQSGGHRQQVVVLYGLGGMGKTQLAAEFVRRHQIRFMSVFWLDGSSDDNLRQSIADCVSRIPEGQIAETSRKYSSGANGDLEAVTRDFIEWLSRTENKHWLIIFDNVDRDYHKDEAEPGAYDIGDYIPDVEHGSVLITTRLANLRLLGDSLHLGSVDVSQARAIFREWYDRDFDPTDSDELLRLLDGLPLALAQAAAYMSETGAGFSAYTRLYKQQWKELMETKGAAPLRNYKHGNVKTTWMISYNAIRAKNESAANLLLFWAHLDNKMLQYWILQAASSNSSGLAEHLSKWLEDAPYNERKFLDMMGLLRNYCLVEGQEIPGYSTHSVVHQWAFHMQDEHQRAELSRLAILVIAYALPNEYDVNYRLSQRHLLPHAECWIEKKEGDIVDTEEESDNEMLGALLGVGNILYEQDKLSSAEKMYQRALEGYEKAWGPNYTSTLDTVNNLGLLYAGQGKLADAEKMYQRALEGKEKAWGPNNTSTLNTVHNLGLLYANQGKLADAEKMYQRALEGFEKAWGPNHTSTLNTVNNLGNLYKSQGKLANAKKMYQRALEGKEKAWGPNHTSTLHTVNNLGLLYADQGKLADAEKMYQRALEGYKKVWGPNHTWILNTVHNLGNLYRSQGKLANAKNMYQRALEGKEKAWGPNHTSTLDTVNSLGSLYADQGKLADAEKMYQHALEGYEKALGPENIVSYLPALHAAYNLGRLFAGQGRIDKATLMYTRALKGYEIVYGVDHEECQDARQQLHSLERSGIQGSKRHRLLRKLKAGWK